MRAFTVIFGSFRQFLLRIFTKHPFCAVLGLEVDWNLMFK